MAAAAGGGGEQASTDLQHPGEASLLEVGGLSEVHGAGHVRGAVLVLRPGVEQQHLRRAHHGRLVGRGAVVDDGAVRTRTRDRVEAAA